jgi:hypothetical protein
VTDEGKAAIKSAVFNDCLKVLMLVAFRVGGGERAFLTLGAAKRNHLFAKESTLLMISTVDVDDIYAHL